MIVFIRQDLATQVPKSKHKSLDAAEGNKWREDLSDRLPAVAPSQLRAGGTLPWLAISSPRQPGLAGAAPMPLLRPRLTRGRTGPWPATTR